MSKTETASAGCGCALIPFLGMFSIWGLVFIIIKLWGTALAAWSWLWIFVPIIPVLFIVLQKLGLL